MNLDLLAILIFITSSSIILWVVLREVRRTFGFRKTVLSLLHLVYLLPWLLHYRKFLVGANSDFQSLYIYIVPLFISLLTFLAVKVESQIARASNALVPFLAFCATLYYIMPKIYEENQNYIFDNIPTIWLFFWTVIATSAILSYILPLQIFRLR